MKLATFKLATKWAAAIFGHFRVVLQGTLLFYRVLYSENWPIGQLVASFKIKSGQQKMAESCGFLDFLASWPVLFLNLYEKKIKNYNKVEKKVANWPLVNKIRYFIILHSTLLESQIIFTIQHFCAILLIK